MEFAWYELGIMVALISFLGYALENIWLLITKGYMDNRNMTRPFLLGYGLCVVGMYLVLGTPLNMKLFGVWEVECLRVSDEVLYFLAALLIVGIGEIVLGKLVEHFCHIQYWNYNWIPLHITQYTSIPTSIGFATIITLFMKFCFLPILLVIRRLADDILKIASIILLIVMGVDFVASFKKMAKNHALNELWRWYPGEGFVEKDELRLMIENQETQGLRHGV